jgi:hypothetical protein
VICCGKCIVAVILLPLGCLIGFKTQEVECLIYLTPTRETKLERAIWANMNSWALTKAWKAFGSVRALGKRRYNSLTFLELLEG